MYFFKCRTPLFLKAGSMMQHNFALLTNKIFKLKGREYIGDGAAIKPIPELC